MKYLFALFALLSLSLTASADGNCAGRFVLVDRGPAFDSFAFDPFAAARLQAQLDFERALARERFFRQRAFVSDFDRNFQFGLINVNRGFNRGFSRNAQFGLINVR